jgi:hypothetical protein
MKINKTLKRALAIGVGAYILAYAGLAGYALVDIKKNFWNTFDKAQNFLTFREFSCEIDGRKKKLGLVGEKHLYNHKEQLFAGELIKRYETLAFEGSVNEPRSKIDRILDNVCSTLNYPYIYFYATGSGRRAPHPYDIERLKNSLYNSLLQKEKIIPLIPLEEHSATDDMNLTQKALAFIESAKELAIAPMAYFKGKKELNLPRENKEKSPQEAQKELGWYRANGEKRDYIMADKIVTILEDDKTDNLLCAVGKAHVEGIISNLEQMINLERIKTEQEKAEK